MSKKDFLPRWAVSEGNGLLSEGLNHYSRQIQKMANKHRADLALIVAAMKLGAPVLENYLHDAEKAVLDMVVQSSITVDLTNLAQGVPGHE